MSLLVTAAAALLLLLAGCGSSDRQQAPTTSRPVSTPRTTTASTPPETATSESEPASTAESEQPPAVPTPTAAGPWMNCGRILSPLDKRPQRVEARVFDCRAARRVAVRYLRNGALPRGWTQADCAASRAACEQGGWAFRVTQD